MKKRFVALLLALATLGITGCSTKADTSTENTGTDSNGTEQATEDATEYKYKVAFCAIDLSSDSLVEQADRMVEWGKHYGVQVDVYDNQANGEVAVQVADMVAKKDYDAVIEFNADSSVGQVVMDTFNAADLPVIAVDIEHPGAVFFGADNEYCGILAGNYLGTYAKENWGGEFDALVMLDQAASGELPRQRILKAQDGMAEVLGECPDDKVFIIEGAADASLSQENMASFLQAHPDFDQIAIVCLNDANGEGVVAAIETAGRQDDCKLVVNNEGYFKEYVKTHPEEDFFGGCVSFSFVDYGKWIIPDVIEMLETGETPESFYIDHELVTRENVDEALAYLDMTVQEQVEQSK